ncbi:DUF397 domain-containing protein [Streptomyces sp. NPDC058086]|uniref:DUF397 domain-containing protein n=1 Tax=Streptomyces sp. NPDC058086 TaxID=3346334 RepID=UPI0036F0EAB0
MRSVDLTAVTWRKSSYSNPDGGACVEVSDDLLAAAAWRKSSYSNSDGGQCLEVVDNLPAPIPLVPVRDSKNPHGPALILPAAAWASFVTAVRRDELPGA